MDLKILSSLNELTDARNDCLVIGTHSGVFHCDDVVACAILCLAYEGTKKIRILRAARNSREFDTCDICVDVGGGKYDHHQPGFDKHRSNGGALYASAGLVWKDYGKLLVTHELVISESKTAFHLREMIFSVFDASVIVPVDMADNGIKGAHNVFDFITSYLPLWNDKQLNYNEQFEKALNITIDVLLQLIKTQVSSAAAEVVMDKLYQSSDSFFEGVLCVPCQNDVWIKNAVNINKTIETFEEKIVFVAFEYPAGGWAAQCIPPSMEDNFKQLVPFPKEWAGQTEKLAEISGVDGATLCQNGRFFVRAETKEAVIALCQKAIRAKS